MRDDICTIPVSEVFEVNDGCPICRMKKTVETHIIDYIMGAAMMEPDVRIETNKKGFCREHFSDMLSHRGRLALALMIETHLDEQKKVIFDGKLFNSPIKKASKVSRLNESCFICDKIEWGMSRMIETLYRCYETEMDFRDLFNNQKMFCLPHYEMLVNNMDKKKMRNFGDVFVKNITRITEEYLSTLTTDIKNYCKVYNYQGNKENCDWENAKDSVERSIGFLTAKNFE